MEEERRYKAVLVDPQEILDMVGKTGTQGEFYKYAEFDGLEGAKAVHVDFSYNHLCFVITLWREDWPIVQAIEPVTRKWNIIQRQEVSMT